jgi:hypothetical protein
MGDFHMNRTYIKGERPKIGEKKSIEFLDYRLRDLTI